MLLTSFNQATQGNMIPSSLEGLGTFNVPTEANEHTQIYNEWDFSSSDDFEEDLAKACANQRNESEFSDANVSAEKSDIENEEMYDGFGSHLDQNNFFRNSFQDSQAKMKPADHLASVDSTHTWMAPSAQFNLDDYQDTDHFVADMLRIHAPGWRSSKIELFKQIEDNLNGKFEVQ